MDVRDSLALAARTRRAACLRCRSASDLDSLARGLATLLPHPVDIFKFEGDSFRRGEGDQLVHSLVAGRTVLLVHADGSALLSSFADGWHEYLRHPRRTSISIGRNLILNPRHEEFSPGFLACLQIFDGPAPHPHKAWECWLRQEEIDNLEAIGRRHTRPVALVGASSAKFDVSMKEICFLHHRDPPGTSRLPLIEELTNRSGMITWTFVQTMLLDRSNKWMLDSPQAAGRVTPEQLQFADAAYHYLSERQRQGPLGLGVAVYPSVYDVVWNYRRLENQGSIFRGQWNVRWPLDSSLLRPDAGDLPLSLSALVGRLKQTEAFLAELRNRQRQLLGAELDDDSLLAIAQHYGFPTPLLDYTRSLDVAAFFATEPAAGLAQGSEMIGVIYYMRPDRSELSAPGELQNIGLPGFSLLQSASIRIGDVSIIEPHIPDEDNRIARQKGLFISGYRTRDLQGIAIDRLYFRQLPGEVYEDPSADVTADHLLPDSSPVALLAQEVKDRIPLQTGLRLDGGLADVFLPGGGIIGSQGALLFAQVREAGDFFESLVDAVNNARDITDPGRVLRTLGRIFADYFQNAHAVSAVDEVPMTQAGLSSLDPLQIALDELAELCEMDRDVLDQMMERPLDMPWTREQRGDLNADIGESNSGASGHQARTPTLPLGRVAIACALYLTSWTHLIQVDGEAARTIVQNAQYVLLEGN